VLLKLRMFAYTELVIKNCRGPQNVKPDLSPKIILTESCGTSGCRLRIFGFPSTEEEMFGIEKACKVEVKHGFSTVITKLV